jgi:uncharacterized cupin superfamily protein
MPVRTEPLLAIRAPKVSDLIRAATALTQGDPDGHCLQNRRTVDAIGSRISGEYATYPNIDRKTKPRVGYVHKDGTPYPKMERRGR